jgi:hypothetical protein
MRWLGFLVAVCTLVAAFGCDESLKIPTQPEGRTIRIADYDYIEGKYFFLFNPNDPNAPTGGITKIHLYLDDKDPRNNQELGALKANLYIDPRNRTGPTVDGQFHLLADQVDYTVPNSQNYGFPMVWLQNFLSPSQTLAVAYITAADETVGTWIDQQHPIGSDSTLVLKMLRPSDDQWGDVRYLEAKNVYSLGVHDIEPGSLTVNVVRDIGGEGAQNPDYIDTQDANPKRRTRLLQALGLDQKNNVDTSNRNPDLRIDPEYVDLANGLIFFPDLRPFDPDAADIDGTPGGRQRSWPRDPNVDRPDTLGWHKLGPEAFPSTSDIRSTEVIPEIYNLRWTELTRNNLQHHLYSIVATISPIP